MQSGVPEFYRIVFYLVHFVQLCKFQEKACRVSVFCSTAQHSCCVYPTLYSAGIMFYRLLTQLQQGLQLLAHQRIFDMDFKFHIKKNEVTEINT